MHSSSYPESGMDFNQDCGLYSPTTEIQNQPFVNKDVHSFNRRPVKSKTRGTHGLHLLPQTLGENPNKRHLPSLHSKQQFKRGSYAIPHAESQPITSDNYYPLPANSLEMDGFTNEKQNICTDRAPSVNFRKENAKLRMPQSTEIKINILVFGPAYLITCLLQTFSGINKLKFSSPYSFAFERNISRCGNSMTVSVWKIDDLSKSIRFLKSCLSERSTIMLVLNTMNTAEISTVKRLINSLRQDISRIIPIILVKIKLGMEILGNENGNVSSDMIKKGFKLKAQQDLSAYLECWVDSKEEIEAVMFTALDVSFLKNC